MISYEAAQGSSHLITLLLEKVTPSAGHLYKGSGRKNGGVRSPPACPCLVSTATPSLALEPASMGFQHRQETRIDTQPHPHGTGQLTDSWTPHSQLSTSCSLEVIPINFIYINI